MLKNTISKYAPVMLIAPLMQSVNFLIIFAINSYYSTSYVGEYVFYTSAIYFTTNFFYFRLHELIYSRMWGMVIILAAVLISTILVFITFLLVTYRFEASIKSFLPHELDRYTLIYLFLASLFYYWTTIIVTYMRRQERFLTAVLVENLPKLFIAMWLIYSILSNIDFLSFLPFVLLVIHFAQVIFALTIWISKGGARAAFWKDGEVGKLFLKQLFHSNILGYLKLSTPPNDAFLISMTLGYEISGQYALVNSILNIVNLLRSTATNVILPSTSKLYLNDPKHFYYLVKRLQYLVTLGTFVVIPILALSVTNLYSYLYGFPTFGIQVYIVLYLINQYLVIIYSPHFQLGVIFDTVGRRTLVLAIKTAVLLFLIYVEKFSIIALISLELMSTIFIRFYHDRLVEKKWRMKFD